nr:MAG TPA: hypothetical protein [Caudoviricetes sp.]DAU31426.1 MAG TPA: hypothetical protein [Caudoviricetes sp.]
MYHLPSKARFSEESLNVRAHIKLIIMKSKFCTNFKEST